MFLHKSINFLFKILHIYKLEIRINKKILKIINY